MLVSLIVLTPFTDNLADRTHHCLITLQIHRTSTSVPTSDIFEQQVPQMSNRTIPMRRNVANQHRVWEPPPRTSRHNLPAGPHGQFLADSTREIQGCSRSEARNTSLHFLRHCRLHQQAQSPPSLRPTGKGENRVIRGNFADGLH